MICFINNRIVTVSCKIILKYDKSVGNMLKIEVGVLSPQIKVYHQYLYSYTMICIK